MSIEKMTDDVEIIQALSDNPNSEDGLTSEDLKKKFDEGSRRIKNYINKTLVPAVNQKMSTSDLCDGIDMQGGHIHSVSSITLVANDGSEEGVYISAEAPRPDSDGHFYAVARFMGTVGDDPTVLSGLRDGLEDGDAATVGQLRNLAGDFSDSIDQIHKMQKDIADLKYFPIDITQITGGNTVEMGSVVNDVTISWTLNKEPASQTVDGESVDVSARSKAFMGLAISANKTFTLAVTDERGATDSASASVSFLNGVYYGVWESGIEVDAAAILTLTRKLQGEKGIAFTANAGATQRIVYAIPARYGTPVFNVGGFDGGFKKAKTFDFKNASGYTESYDVWLSENVGLGSTTVKVS